MAQNLEMLEEKNDLENTITVEVYKDDVDKDGEFSIYVSEQCSSGAKYNHLSSKTDAAKAFLKYLDEQTNMGYIYG